MPLVVSNREDDEAVMQYALQYVFAGYDVRARIEGWFEAPDYMNGYKPDIVARKEDHFIIIEVKKGDADWPKISAFELFARDHGGFEFKVIVPPPAAPINEEQRVHAH